MALHLFGSPQYPLVSTYKDPAQLARPLLERWWYSWVSLFFIRFKYYFAWKVAEGACVMAGFGFQGYVTSPDGQCKVKGWEGISNIDILGFETAGNTSRASKAWNKGGWPAPAFAPLCSRAGKGSLRNSRHVP
jgi:hypothetical protein